jgi:ATP-dependent helicase HrpB
MVKAWLAAGQERWLEELLPERIELPNGRKSKITYKPDSPPVIAARIQDLYGITGEIRIARGKVPLVIQVLAPNQRPIQVTQNLGNFWKESYPKIKQELQRKYPKHEWR